MEVNGRVLLPIQLNLPLILFRFLSVVLSTINDESTSVLGLNPCDDGVNAFGSLLKNLSYKDPNFSLIPCSFENRPPLAGVCWLNANP